MGKLQVIVGGQFGSEGKGMIAGYLASQEGRLMAVRVAGSNAGHTVWDERGDQQYKLRHLPVAAVTNRQAELRLAAGSEIEISVLQGEIRRLEEDGYDIGGRLFIDPQATVVTFGNHEAEAGIDTGTTGKGIGAARADRALRRAPLYKNIGPLCGLSCQITDVADDIGSWLASGSTVMIEGTQGYGLGLHAGYYPYCTSSDCRAIDFLGMAGVSPWASEIDQLEVWVVLRAHPIRIAGNSGPLKGETTWQALGVAEEYTTVTNKVRRVGEWDPELARAAIWANGGPERVHLALTFADYLIPGVSGRSDHGALYESGLLGQVERIENELLCGIEIIGTGPTTVIDRRTR